MFNRRVTLSYSQRNAEDMYRPGLTGLVSYKEAPVGTGLGLSLKPRVLPGYAVTGLRVCIAPCHLDAQRETPYIPRTTYLPRAQRETPYITPCHLASQRETPYIPRFTRFPGCLCWCSAGTTHIFRFVPSQLPRQSSD